MKIGVVGDTHIPDASFMLPARIDDLFKGLDILLHVGDVCDLSVLKELQETYTLTFAVWGERDLPELRHYLEEQRVVRFGDRRVGMIHGHQYRGSATRIWDRLRQSLFGGSATDAQADYLLDRFASDDVHAIVFGHTHRPLVKMHKGVLLFNPGAALPGIDVGPSVGILEVTRRSIAGRIVPLYD
jgi:putative phosphoesterase